MQTSNKRKCPKAWVWVGGVSGYEWISDKLKQFQSWVRICTLLFGKVYGNVKVFPMIYKSRHQDLKRKQMVSRGKFYNEARLTQVCWNNGAVCMAYVNYD